MEDNSIRIGCWNIQGLFSKSSEKCTDKLFLKEIVNLDIVGLLETHTIEGQCENKQIANFETKYFNRSKHKRARNGSGGIAILMKPNIWGGIKLFPSKNNDYVWLKLEKSFFSRDQDLYICIAYVPPANSTYTKKLDENILDQIENDILY